MHAYYIRCAAGGHDDISTDNSGRGWRWGWIGSDCVHARAEDVQDRIIGKTRWRWPCGWRRGYRIMDTLNLKSRGGTMRRRRIADPRGGWREGG